MNEQVTLKLKVGQLVKIDGLPCFVAEGGAEVVTHQGNVALMRVDDDGYFGGSAKVLNTAQSDTSVTASPSSSSVRSMNCSQSSVALVPSR